MSQKINDSDSRRERCFISVTGKDRQGIVARISGYLYRQGLNIEDINQRVMQDYFVMMMLVDTAGSAAPLAKIRQGLSRIGREMGLHIQLQHENIFKSMHRV